MLSHVLSHVHCKLVSHPILCLESMRPVGHYSLRINLANSCSLQQLVHVSTLACINNGFEVATNKHAGG